MNKIIKNAARCHNCGDIIESKSVHSFVRCSCGNIAVDGGREYLRRIGGALGFDDLSVGEDNV